ncbi:16S rRNA (guanine(527)-N(7))-methyltransferase RsmG [Youngiibacter multivorans]|uniref:Ribosomal RNA small subunit methyltransferase G n=1 Tax=Youngiibacter multivorans TaxID=937251 RepID=A0ABS4FZ67_9CLOT|nr:16S rRNA (guanine(527)-N(7))-methyltransferase RsmG [Youngiibacter multivorans]MBP1917552.1 16S rRNA (guanine527-N7)-methyltransferase [Youngiibacter multivorans]
MYFEYMKSCVNEMGIEFDEIAYGKFIRYSEMLIDWNSRINLTAITDMDGIIKKHFIDSLKIFEFSPIKKARKIIDVGTGAGFPGIPMKIINDDFELTLLDSLNKRIDYLKEVCKELKLENVDFVHARAEDGARMPEHREKYDLAVSRAVANMAVLSELCLPFVKTGGYFIALKGPGVETELSEAKKAITEMGGKLLKVINVAIKDTDLNHNIVVVEKIAKTPLKYPRQAGLVSKNPIK